MYLCYSFNRKMFLYLLNILYTRIYVHCQMAYTHKALYVKGSVAFLELC